MSVASTATFTQTLIVGIDRVTFHGDINPRDNLKTKDRDRRLDQHGLQTQLARPDRPVPQKYFPAQHEPHRTPPATPKLTDPSHIGREPRPHS
jgi:hypothetical protein